MIFSSSLYILGQKEVHTAQIMKNFLNTLEATVWFKYPRNLSERFFLRFLPKGSSVVKN
jgi:hypothetical protein